ncbi:hypothetical protein C8R47DRAFT_1230155 [Mycena vitilis]|nr:hypothetical protein C8R47DRAFT_1230155 [Mycena vitilis]
MASNPSQPALPAAILAIERATVVGDALSQMIFGIVVCVFLQTMYHLVDGPPRRHENRNLPLIAFTTVIFALGMVFVSMDLTSLRLAFVDNRNFPGGPIAYSLAQYGQPIVVIPNACAIIGDWLAAGFLLYRCVIIFQMNFAVIFVPALMYLGSIAMGVMVLFQSSRPNANLWTKTSVNFGIPYFALSAALNVLITVLITTRLLLYRRSLRDALGDEEAMSVPFATVASMLVESSLLYAVTSTLFLVPYGLKSSVSNIFLPILIEIQLLAPLLIIYRVAKRRGWEKGTATRPPTTLKFQHTFQRTGARSGLHDTENGSGADTEREDDVVAIDFIRRDTNVKEIHELTSSSATGMVQEI